MLLSNLEYIILRVIRKFIFKQWMLKGLEKVIPYYQSSQNEISPIPVVDLYWDLCFQNHINPIGKKILEIGSGATDSIGYEIVGRGAKYIGYEPYIRLDKEKDQKIFNTIIMNRYPNVNYNSISRISKLSILDEQSVDIIFSHSVLEHVNDFNSLLSNLKRILKKDGCMFHIVDYRDHFFKYPFHFLLFSKKTWENFLNPGDLSRLRISDHIESFHKHGFDVQILKQKMEMDSFNRVKQYLHKDFKKYTDEDIATIYAIFFVKWSNNERKALSV